MDAGPSRRGADAGAGNGHYQSPPLCNRITYQSPYCTVYAASGGALLGSPNPNALPSRSLSLSQIKMPHHHPLLIHKTFGIRPWTRHHHKACQAVRAFPAHMTRGSACNKQEQRGGCKHGHACALANPLTRMFSRWGRVAAELVLGLSSLSLLVLRDCSHEIVSRARVSRSL